MNDNLKISVILPVYNCEKFIERAIKSVQNQTYRNWELIVVNDGSTDRSSQIVKKYMEKDPRIHLNNKENEGVSVARNIGIDMAVGDLIMFLDADDWFTEDAFEVVMHHWDYSVQMVLFDYYDVPENQNRKYRKHFKEDRIRFGTEGDYSIDELEVIVSGFYHEQRNNTVLHAPWGKVFEAEYLKERPCRFPADVFNCEDQVFNLFAVDGMTDVLYISNPVYCYYINVESVTFSAYKKDGEKLLKNVINRNVYVKDLFLSKKKSELYENAYYQYLYDGVKIILWWLAEERNKDKKREGRKFCYGQVKEIRKHLCEGYGLSDKMLLLLCQMKCFGIVEQIVRLRKKAKNVLNVR